VTDISSTNQASPLQPEDGENTSPALPVNEEDRLRFEALLDSGMAESEVRPGGLLARQPSSNEYSAPPETRDPSSSNAEENSSGQTESSSSETNQPSSQSSTSTPQSQTSQTSQNSKDDSSGSGTNSGGGSSKQSSEANQSISEGSAVAPVIGQSILSSLGISSSAPGGVESTEAVGASRTVAELGSELVDRLYSASPDDEKGGVLLKFKDDLLPETEVRLFKDENGVLNVNFSTTSSEAAALLNQHQGRLANYLQNQLGGSVRVNLEDKGADSGGGDGRSRQRRSVLDEYKPS
jgi:type III secretion system needle length determinant